MSDNNQLLDALLTESKKLATADTSLKKATIAGWITNAKPRSILSCTKITGLQLFKLSDGGASWRYRYTNAAGERKAVVIGSYPEMPPGLAASTAALLKNTRTDALEVKQKKRQAALDERLAAAQQAQQVKRRSLGAYLRGPYEQHQKKMKHEGQHTLKEIGRAFAAYADRDMATINEDMIHEWQASQMQNGIARATIQRRFREIKTMLRQAVRDGVIDSFPLDGAKLRGATYDEKKLAHEKAEGKEHERRALTDDEVVALFAGLDALDQKKRQERRNSRAHGKQHLESLDDVAFAHWFVPFATLAFYTGLRPGDLFVVTWKNLNTTFGRLRLIPEKVKHHGEDAAVVDLPLDGEVLAVMRRWHEQQGKPVDGLVFPSPVTGRAMDGQAHGKAWKTVKELGGLRDDLDFYCLRHNFISRMIAENVPAVSIAEMVGHKTTLMLQRHYSHLFENQARKHMAALGNSTAKLLKPAGLSKTG